MKTEDHHMKTFGMADAGCYVDEARGIYATDAIVEFARAYGAEIESCKVSANHPHAETVMESEFGGCEFANEIEEYASNYMNTHYEVDGYYWGRNENGDWGLWNVEEDEREDDEDDSRNVIRNEIEYERRFYEVDGTPVWRERDTITHD